MLLVVLLSLREQKKVQGGRRLSFENQLRTNKAIGNAEGIATAKGNIVYAKSMYEGGNNNEELLNSTHDVYKLRAAEYGEKYDYTISAGKILAMSLQNANCWGEARELLTWPQASKCTVHTTIPPRRLFRSSKRLRQGSV
jgi:hypothetical protein